MRVAADRLDEHLRGELAACYLISGDEPLQLGECADAVRRAAREAGHSQRIVFEAGSGFDWQALAGEAAAFSLFAERKLLDLRIPNGKPGTEGSRALVAYCENPPPDSLLLVTLPRLDRTQQNSKWFKALDRLGVNVPVWPVEPQRLPGWIEQRLRRAGINPTHEAVQLLAARVEGNLLAAQQEIDKLVLLHGTGSLDVDQLAAAVADSARYDVFELVDSALRGEAARCVHVLDGLRGEGVAAPVVLWALHREVATLARISTDVAKGMPLDQAIAQSRIFSRRTDLVRRALGRLRAPQWLALLDRCHAIDAAIKGVGRNDPWLLLEQALLLLGGQAWAAHDDARATG